MPEAQPDTAAATVFASSNEMEPFDYLMFRTEADPHSRSAGMGIEILDRVPDWERLVDAFDRASRVVVRMRQKVVVPTVALSTPRWVVDPDFDLTYHVRRIAVPPPGTLRQVLDLAITMVEAPLDTARALWEVALVEGLEGGRAALITKMSHAVTDGLGGMQLAKQIYDADRDPPLRPMPPLPIPEDVTPQDLTRHAARRLPMSAVETAARGVGTLVGTAGRSLRQPAKSVSDAAAFVRSARRMFGAPPVEPSPLLRRRSLASRLEHHEVSIDALRRAGKAADCSVNDAYVAAVCGALRRYHEALGVPVEAVPMAIPISLRTSDDPAGGNRFGGARLRAPVGEEDPVERMWLIREQVLAARAEPAIGAMNLLAPVLSRVPASMLYGLTASTDVQASNVPGDPNPRYIAGALIEKQVPCGPLPGVAMMVVLLSLAGRGFVGVRYDTASVTEFDLFARCLREGFDEVIAVGDDGGLAGGASADNGKTSTSKPKNKKTAAAKSRAGNPRPGTKKAT